MKFREFGKSLADYIKEIYLEKSKEIPQEGVHADLHMHPYIKDRNSLEHTLDVMYNNEIDLLAITTHGKGSKKEHDFWKVKELIKEEGMEMDDKGRYFSIDYKEKQLNFIGGYEMYVYLPDVKGRIDIISLMPEKGFEKVAEKGMNFDDYMELNRKYDSMVVGAHPFTLWDPFLYRLIPFRLADEEERRNIQENFFTEVDCVDLVATNALWMKISDKLVEECYEGKALANSDVHAKCRFARTRIGESRNIFPELDLGTDSELYGSLLDNIRSGNFESHLKHLSPEQFFVSLCTGDNPPGFP
ncbi:hypothetical protein GF336_06275 [Candidatus Woesearchaeota archaeon]|nr:hypothetical protein [Candidatus Woesearchaeota archaeon]